MEREIWPYLIKNKTQTAVSYGSPPPHPPRVTNIVSFRIFMNLTFRICYQEISFPICYLAVEFGL